MSRLDESRLENICRRDGKIIARCPACFEQGHDKTGEHLFINENGKFGCVQFPRDEGVEHRKRISELVGVRDEIGSGGNDSKPRKEFVCAYDYTDESGKQLFQVVRYKVPPPKNKTFSQRHDGGSGWIWNMKGVRRVLYRLPQVIAAETVIVVEGEKDADNLTNLRFTATTNVGGAKKWRPEYSEVLQGKDVIIIGDNDDEGRTHVVKVIESLTGIARSIKHVTLPPEFKDVSDFICSKSLLAKRAIAKLIEDTPVLPPAGAALAESIRARLNSPLPKVQLPGDDRLLSAFSADIADILKDRGLYQRNGMAFIVNEQRDGLELITPAMLRTLVEKSLVCYRMKKGSAGDTFDLWRTMTTEDAHGVLAAHQFIARLPKIERIATARLPVMRKNGAIDLLPDGYDPGSLTLTLSQCEYDPGMPMSVATRVIDGLLAEFPFADKGRSKGVAISGMVGLFVTVLLNPKSLRPVLIYLANAEGAGKTLLAKCAISPTHGLTKVDGDLKDRIETRKEISTAVIEARPYILFDNCKRHISSSALEALASAAIYKGRILGFSKSFEGANLMTVFITGNGATVSPDMRRRALFVELFMDVERAEDRVFRRILDDAELLEMRPKILAALWALVREWNRAGRPGPTRTHSAFPRWAQIVGGIVEHAGYVCPLETAEIPAAADVDGSDMRELVKLLKIDECLKFDDLVKLTRANGLFERIVGSESDGDLKPSEKNVFGKLLKRYDRRIFSDSRVFVIDGKGHSRTFRVVENP